MNFLIKLNSARHSVMPINYQYPLSSAIYRIISKGDVQYADFLHEKGYGKGFKLFTFSQLQVPFKIEGDRMRLTGDEANFQVAFHLPQAMESFVKGLFQSETIEIADKKSRAVFRVKSVESLPNPVQQHKDNEIINMQLKPLSPIVAGLRTEDGKYSFLSPDSPKFAESLMYNWRSKIRTCYDDATASSALLMVKIIPMKTPFKSRLITIKEGKEEETKIRGWMNLGIKVTAEKRFVELLLNSGLGVYNSQGMGYVEVVNCDENKKGKLK
ncbi:CRISPR-associated endoribonuclease Cas6 [Weeksellaceae bacterium A-14]